MIGPKGTGKTYFTLLYFTLLYFQDHSIGEDGCVIGPKGSGKTAAVRAFAASLGYEPHVVYCYKVSEVK